jgi:photosystem II stability/assembly factor-like uncharacterized protein
MLIRLSFILLVFLMPSPCTILQAWEIAPGQPNVTAVAADANEQRLIVGLLQGGFWLSNDGGESWEAITDRVSPDHRPGAIQDFIVIDAQADTIITRSGFFTYPSHTIMRQQIVVTADGGLTWRFPYGQSESTFSEFMIVDRCDNQTFYYLSLTYFHRSHDFGFTWGDEVLVDEHFNQKFNFIQDTMNDSCLLASTFYTEYYPGGIFRSLDKGETWQPILEPQQYYVGHDGIVMSDIDRLSNGDLVATVPLSFFPDTSLNSFLRSTDDGLIWTEEYPLPTNYYPYQLVEVIGDEGHLLVRADEYGFPNVSTYLYESLDYGYTFEPIAEPARHELVNVGYLSNNPHRTATYAGTWGNGAWKTEDYGASWQEFPTPRVSTLCNANHQQDFTSHVQQFGLTGYLKRLSDAEYFEFTYPYPPPDSSQFALPIISVSGDTLRGLYSRRARVNNSGHIYVTESYDAGATWNDPFISFPEGDFYNYTPIQTMEDDGNGYAVIPVYNSDGDYWRLYMTADAGESWETIDMVPGIAHLKSTYHIRANYLYAVHPEQDIQYKPLSEDTWDTLYHPNPSYLAEPGAVIIDEDIEAIYTLSSVHGYRYLDDEWTQLGVLPYPNVNFATAIPRPDMEPVLFVGTWENPHIYVSYDGGYEWDTITLPYHDQMKKTQGLHYDHYRDRIWANTRLGLMWEDASVFTSVAESDVQIPETHDLMHVYPNPFNAQTTVTIRLEKSDEVTLTLFNTLGQEVRTLIDERLAAGEHSVSIDGSSLASGTYFLRLMTTDGTAATRKIELIR